MKILHLHLNFKYFDDIKAGIKDKEYRLASKWKHKLDSNDYTHIRLYRGFEAVTPNTIIDLPYRGYIEETIIHEHFGSEPVDVCAIDVKH